MNQEKNQDTIDHYQFHHIDTSKCKICENFECEEACFRGIYTVQNKESDPKCIVNENREDRCVKCHLCTTACKLQAIPID